MPAKSQAQRAYLFQHFGSEWAHRHGFANKGKLPKHVKHALDRRHEKGKKS